jgi:hypothetical protein
MFGENNIAHTPEVYSHTILALLLIILFSRVLQHFSYNAISHIGYNRDTFKLSFST